MLSSPPFFKGGLLFMQKIKSVIKPFYSNINQFKFGEITIVGLV
jgi:hypothetical protein